MAALVRPASLLGLHSLRAVACCCTTRDCFVCKLLLALIEAIMRFNYLNWFPSISVSKTDPKAVPGVVLSLVQRVRPRAGHAAQARAAQAALAAAALVLVREHLTLFPRDRELQPFAPPDTRTC